MYKGHMDKAKGGWDWGWEVGMAGVGGSGGGGKWRQLYLNKNKKEKNFYLSKLQYSSLILLYTFFFICV